MDTQRADKLHSTVVINGRFGERKTVDLAARQDGRATTAETLESGSKLGRYLIINRLGGGGMGIVYKAHDTELDRTVALKILPPHLCKHTEYLNRFRAEAQAQARLNSPHVVMLYSLMELPAGEVLVLEHVEGQTLEQRIRSHGPLPLPEAIEIFERALIGVDHIHEMGIVHRDLKPSNIFITADNHIKIMDFGVAKLMDNQDYVQHGAMVGTLLYISPEQINSRKIDFRSDIYTLGISLFETVTGRLPFERRTDYALMHAHVQESPPRPKQLHRQVPPALEWVILKAIEKDPDRRFQSASEFRDALLKLGLMERRHRASAPAPVKAKQRLPNADMFQQELLRYHLASKKRLLGRFGFDLGLIALVFVLIYALGLFPTKQTPPTAKVAVPAVPEKTVKIRRPVAKNRSVKTSTIKRRNPVRTPVRSQGVKKKSDKYKALKKAWGG